MTFTKVQLKRLVDPTRPITYGIVQAGPDVPDGIPYIRPVDMTPYSGIAPSVSLLRTTPEIAAAYRRSTVAPGDVVISIGPSYGKVMVVTDDLSGANLTQGTARVAPSDAAHHRFLYWALQSSEARQHWDSCVGGATFRALNLEPLGRTPVPLVPLHEQRRIAAFLERETARMDKLMDSQFRLMALLKEREASEIAVALSQASTGSIRLKHLLVAPLSYGANEPAEHVRRDWPRYIRTTDIDGYGNLRDETFTSLHPLEARRYLLDDGDVLFVRSGATSGKTFVYQNQYGPAAHAGYLIRARVNRRMMLPSLIWFFCQTTAYWQQIREGMIQATIQNVNAEKYGNLLVPFIEPSRQEGTLQQISSAVQKSRRLHERAGQLLRVLAERRQALITAAVTGQFDVSTASGRNVAEGVTA